MKTSYIKFQIRRLDNFHWDTIAICADKPSELAAMLRTFERVGYDLDSIRVLRYSGRKLSMVAS